MNNLQRELLINKIVGINSKVLSIMLELDEVEAELEAISDQSPPQSLVGNKPFDPVAHERWMMEQEQSFLDRPTI